jgi:hypothetical protein
MSATLKYTDRDVRENPDFENIAIEYLMNYEGEFAFLIDCKMRIASGMGLSIGMVRGILNCMRVDPRAPELPDPQNWDGDADIIPMPERRQPRRHYQNKVDCLKTEPHQHTQDDFRTMHYCPGIWAVSRNEGNYSYKLPAKIHPGYIFVTAKSPSSVLVHRAMWAEVEWFPYIHEFGWARPPQVIIHTNCAYPYYLRNPFLMRVEDVDEFQSTFQLARCVRCFGERDIL